MCFSDLLNTSNVFTEHSCWYGPQVKKLHFIIYLCLKVYHICMTVSGTSFIHTIIQ